MSAPAAVHARRGSCPVCRATEKARQAYLVQAQLRLAVREREQAEHAARGGFCPLHTWQHMAMANAIGVSAGYAKLSDSVAAALERAGARAGDAATLAIELGTLVVGTDTCPVCGTLAEAERIAVADAIVGTAVPDRAPTLCLPHLRLAVATAGPAEGIRTLLDGLAAALRRRSEDMRSYALKREAHHGELLTDEETGAHLEALELLAGRASLVLPGDENR